MKVLVLSVISLLIALPAIGVEKTKNDRKEIERKVVEPVKKHFPPHWGHPPKIQTRDLVPLPGGFGRGSSTLARWIIEHIKADKEKRPVRPKRPEPSEEVKAKITAVRLVQNDLVVARKALLESIKGKSREDITELIKSFKESQKEKHQELKNARKDLAREVREKIQTGDRRE